MTEAPPQDDALAAARQAAGASGFASNPGHSAGAPRADRLAREVARQAGEPSDHDPNHGPPAAPMAERLARAVARQAAGSSDFDLDPGAAPEPPPLRQAGVLLAFHPDGRLILTKRASGLRHHPGQIALPGGKVDPGDDGPLGAALREAEEEVALPRERLRVLGTLAPHRTVTGFDVTPVVALIDGPFTPRPEAGEVAEVFDVPLLHVADLARYRVERRMWRGVWRSYWVAPYGPWYVWGATARILRGLAERLA